MHLAHVGAIRIDAGSYEEPGAFGRMKTVDDYYITRLPAADNVTDPIDRQALDLLFGTLAGGADSLWFGTIKKYGEDHPQEFVDAMQAGRARFRRRRTARISSRRKASDTRATSSRLRGGRFVRCRHLDTHVELHPLIFMIPTAIALGVIGNYMPRRSVKATS